MIWRCRLPAVVSARDRVRPALQQLSEALGLLADPTSGTHEVASKAYGCFSDFELPPTALQLSCTAHMLGIIVRPKLQLGLQKVLRMTKPVVVGVLEMQQAAESAVRVLYRMRRVPFTGARSWVLLLGFGVCGVILARCHRVGRMM